MERTYLDLSFTRNFDFKETRQAFQKHKAEFDAFLIAHAPDVEKRLGSRDVTDLSSSERNHPVIKKWSAVQRQCIEALSLPDQEHLRTTLAKELAALRAEFQLFVSEAVVPACRVAYGKKRDYTVSIEIFKTNFLSDYKPSLWSLNQSMPVLAKVSVIVHGSVRNVNVYHHLQKHTQRRPWNIWDLTNVTVRPYRKVKFEIGIRAFPRDTAIKEHVRLHGESMLAGITDFLNYEDIKDVTVSSHSYKNGVFYIARGLATDEEEVRKSFNSSSWADTIWEGSLPWVKTNTSGEDVLFYPKIKAPSRKKAPRRRVRRTTL